MSTFCKPVMSSEAAAKNNSSSSDTTIDVPPAIDAHLPLRSGRNATRNNCKMEAFIHQFFAGPELAKMFCQVSFAAIFATPVIYYNQMLPVGFCLAISLLLFLGFLGSFSGIALHKAFPDLAGALVLIGTICVVSTVPTITAGVLPQHRLFLSAFFSLLFLFILLGFLWAHRHVLTEIPLDLGEITGSIEAKEGILPLVHPNLASAVDNSAIKSAPEEVAKSPIPEAVNEIPICMKLDSEDVEEEVQFWNSAVICYVLGANPPFKVMEGFIRRVWGKHGIDKISKLPNGSFIVRFHAYSQALRVTEETVTFDGKPVITKLWEPDLSLKKDEISSATVPVWIRFPGLDLKYWSPNCLKKLAAIVGEPRKLDWATRGKERLSFARVLVQVKVNHQLPEWICFEDEAGCQRDQKVDYEWNPSFCDPFCQKLCHRFTNEEAVGNKVWAVKSSGPVAAANLQLNPNGS